MKTKHPSKYQILPASFKLSPAIGKVLIHKSCGSKTYDAAAIETRHCTGCNQPATR